MTNADPFRSDDVAAQERVFQLERELAERDALIEKLRSQRISTIWQKYVKKILAISLISIIGFFSLAFITILFEPNDIYVAEATITKIATPRGIQRNCPPDCNTGYTKGFTFVYEDQDGKQTVDLNPNETVYWPYFTQEKLSLGYDDRTKGSYKVRMGESGAYLGCKVKLHYLRGAWFGDRSWFDPVADTTMCKKPALAEDASVRERVR